MSTTRRGKVSDCELKGSRVLRAFTLIEIMVAIAIVAIIMTVAIPFVYQQLKKDGMRQAVDDIFEACRRAREQAILTGHTTEVRIRPADRTITVGAASGAGSDGPSYGAAMETEAPSERASTGERPKSTSVAGAGGAFSAKLSEHIIIEFIGVNLIPDLQQMEEVTAMFYRNGTSDELVVLMRSDRGEVRKVTTEVVTGLPDVEVVR
jgi:prepilin-type N-terminal cleavage/methylation domain-containing protein